MDEKTTKTLKTAGLIALGLGLGVAGKVGYDAYQEKKAKEAGKDDPASLPAGSVTEVVEPIYTLPGAFSLNLNQLPVVRPRIGQVAGSRVRVIGDDSAQPLYTIVSAESTQNTFGAVPDGMLGIGSHDFLSDILPDLKDEYQGAKASGSLPDVLMVVLSGQQSARPVDSFKAQLAAFRAVIPQVGLRVMWMLTPDAPGTLAKALNEAHEEWYRSAVPHIEADVALNMWDVAIAQNTDQLQTAALGLGIANRPAAS